MSETAREGRLRVVGTPSARVDARAKIEGAPLFLPDLELPGMLYAAIAYARVPHARILGIEVDEARASPGVAAVLTAGDIPGSNQIGAVRADQPLLARERVRFWGDRLALVAAESEAAARLAAGMVRARFDPLPALFDAEEAWKEGAIRIHEEAERNLVAHHQLMRGDVESAMRAADFVLEEEFRTSWQEHVYLETQGALAFWEGETLVVQGSIQCPYHAREKVAAVLGLPPERVCIRVTTIGGGFGGKQDYPNEVAACAALLAHRTRRPVRCMLQRQEDVEVTSKRHPSLTRFRMGLMRNGTIAAADVRVLLDAGAYAAMSPIVLWRNFNVNTGPYRIEHVRIHARAVYTNNVPASAFRGFGHPQALFAHESMMDLAACRLGLDPLEFRRRNLLRRGDRNAVSQVMDEDYRLPECVDEVTRICRWSELRREHARQRRSGGERRPGLGISLMQFGCNLGAVDAALDHSAAVIEIDREGCVDLRLGLVEMGQGALTVLSQVVAETLSVPISRVRASLPDTTRVADSGPSAASRVTMMGGHVVREAALELRRRLTRTAARLARIPEERVDLADGTFSIPGSDRGWSWEEVCRAHSDEEGPLRQAARYDNRYGPWDPQAGQGDAFVAWTHAAQAAEVEVDCVTGRVRVLRVWSAYDIGRPINPALCHGQVEGGVAMGIGYALMEDLQVGTDGEILTKNYSTYLIPTSLDMPAAIETRFVDAECPRGPFGAKSLGEPAFVPTVGAIAGAIHDALGVRPRSVPVTPERILALIRKEQPVPPGGQTG